MLKAAQPLLVVTTDDLLILIYGNPTRLSIQMTDIEIRSHFMQGVITLAID